MADKKKESEFQWLQKQLTEDIDKLDPGIEDEASEYDEETYADPNGKAHNAAYMREMNELQQALASEVSAQVTKKQSPGKKKDTEYSQYDDGTGSTGIQSNYTSDYYSNSSSETITNKQKKKQEEKGKIPVWGGILISCVFIALAAAIIICGKSIAKTALVNIGLIKGEEKEVIETAEITAVPTVTVTATPIVTPEITPEAEEEEEPAADEVLSVLLLGIDSMAEQENADTIVVASINETDHTYHLIQFMRDLVVKIPGYGTEVLSEAFHYGGGRLVADTLSENFDLPIEGYLSTDFDNFTNIIDLMGGIQITLTKDEAHYLNTTNYISQKANRTMEEGKQKANGDQVLGYCRIQEVPNKDDLSYDFGRVTRSKAVLNQLFLKMKELSLGDLLYTMNEALPYIRTNLTKSKFRTMIETMSEIGFGKLDSIRVPVYTLYSRQKQNGRTVYVPDLEGTKQKINSLVYGPEEDSENKK